MAAQLPQRDFRYFYSRYPYEMVCFAVFVCMMFWLIIGKNKTLSQTTKWHNKTLPLLKQNFAYVGVADGQQNMEFE